MRKYKSYWDDIWMRLANDISTRSGDPRLQVGAVIVTEDNESVLAIGYNGDEKGGDNQPDCLEPGKSGFIHAEVNAIAKMNYNDPRPRKIYVTHAPCIVCARLIINSNIKKVIYCYPYRSEQGVELLKKRNIEVTCCQTDFQ
jgi:dCMP deaminase